MSAITSNFITINGLRLHYLAAGADGPPLVLLHGAGIDSAHLSYAPALPALGAHCRVFAPDWPGQGQSDRPDIAYTLDFYIETLAALLDAWGLERAGLAGLSLGGGAALGFALRAPERVARLALIDSYGLGAAVPWGLLGYLLVHSPLNALTWAGLRRSRRLVRQTLRGVAHHPGALDDALVDEAYALVRQPHAERAFSSLQRHEVTLYGLRTDFSARLHELRMPVLISHGAHDQGVPVAWAQRAHARIPGSQLHIFEQSGHWPPREEPEAFNQLLTDFFTAG